MTTPTRRGRLTALVLSLTLAGSLAGCGHVLRSGLDFLGVEPPDRDAPEVTGPVSAALTPSGEVVMSTYEHAPTLDWSTLGMGHPFSVARGLFEGMSPSYGCQAVPLGMAQVTHMPFGAPSTTLHTLGPLELGLAGNVLPLGPLFTYSAEMLARSALATSAELGSRGTSSCGRTLFAYLRVNLTGEPADPVSVLR